MPRKSCGPLFPGFLARLEPDVAALARTCPGRGIVFAAAKMTSTRGNVTMSILVRIVLAAILSSPALAHAAKRAAAPHAIQTEFGGFIAKFRAALKANDSSAIASMTKLPFMEDEAYSDVAQFRAKAYPEFFTEKNRACIQRNKAVYDRDEENNDNYHISCYENTFTFTRTPAGFLLTDVSVND